MSKEMYALTTDSVRRLSGYARNTATIAADIAADELVPLDRDAAVGRMADAMIAASPDRAYITEDEREWYMRDARVALDALLQEEGE